MSDNNGSVNNQIVDSVTGVNTLLTGQAPAHSFGMLDTVLMETLGMAMHNAVNRQQGASVIGTAAMTAACAKMLAAPFPPPPKPAPAPPPPTLPVNVHNLPGPPKVPPPTSEVIAAAYADAEAAIKVLQAEAKGSSTNATTAQNDLAQLVTDAAPPSPAAETPAAQADAAPTGDSTTSGGTGAA